MPDKQNSILPAIASAVPVIGSIGAAALQRNWALKDLAAQNAYNSPRAQIARLKEAGLPLATMFGGQGGSTSEQPAATQVDPTLGAAKGLDAFFTNRMQTAQLALLSAQTRAQNADADLKAGEAKFYGSLGVSGLTNQEEILGAKKDTAIYESIIKGNEQILSNLETEWKTSNGKRTQEMQGQLDQLLNNIKEQNQRIDINALSAKINEALDKYIKNSPSGMAPWKAIILSALRAIGGVGFTK